MPHVAIQVANAVERCGCEFTVFKGSLSEANPFTLSSGLSACER